MELPFETRTKKIAIEWVKRMQMDPFGGETQPLLDSNNEPRYEWVPVRFSKPKRVTLTRYLGGEQFLCEVDGEGRQDTGETQVAAQDVESLPPGYQEFIWGQRANEGPAFEPTA